MKKIWNNIIDKIYLFLIGFENALTGIRIKFGEIVDYKQIDKQFGIDTQKIDDTTYIPISTKVFHIILNKIGLKEDISFLDYGSGKGKALILAAEAGIKEIGGVEFDKELVSLSEKNIETYKEGISKEANIDVVLADATKYTDIDKYNVFFINNSFGGNPSEERLVAKILANIENSLNKRKRPIRIVYVHPGISLRKLFDTYDWLSDRTIIRNPYRPKRDGAYIYIFNID